jgi:hypothetical protein
MKMNEKQFKLLIEITYSNNINKLIIETYNEISLEELKTKSIKKFNIEKKQKNNIIFYYEDEQGDINIINKIEDIYEAAKETTPYLLNIKLKLKAINFKNKNIKNIDVNENIYKNKYLKENEKLKFELEGIKHEKNKEIKMLKNIIKRNEKEYLNKLSRKESRGNMDPNDINEIKNFMKENKGKSFIQLFIEEKQNFMNEMNKFKQDIIKKIEEELKSNNPKNKKINNNLVNEDIKKYYNNIINKLDNIIGLSSRKSSNEIINKLDNIIQDISKNQQKLLSLLQKDNEIKNEINKKQNINSRKKENIIYENKSSDNIHKNNKILNNKLQYNSYKSINRISYLKKNEFLYNNKVREVIPYINKTGNNIEEKEKEEKRIEEEENEDDEEEEEEEEVEYIKSIKPEIKNLEIRKLEYKKSVLKTPEKQRQEIRKIEIKTPEVKKRWEIKTPERIEGPEIKKRLLKTPDFKGENKEKGEDKMELYKKMKKIEKKEGEEEDDDKEEEETEEEEENEEQIKYSIQLNEKLKDLFFNKNGILKAKPLNIKQLEDIENLYDTLLDKKQNIQEYQDKYINIIKKETNNSNLPEQKKNLIYRQIRIIQELIEKTIKGYKKDDNK